MSDLRAKVEQMINQLVVEIGLSKKQTFNAERRAWYWKRGSASIEIFIQEVHGGSTVREFLRVFSPLIKVPKGKELAFYRRLLEMNDTNLGVKLTIMKNTNQVYVTYECDIVGMDYEELKISVLDLEWWADELDDILIAEFKTNK